MNRNKKNNDKLDTLIIAGSHVLVEEYAARFDSYKNYTIKMTLRMHNKILRKIRKK